MVIRPGPYVSVPAGTAIALAVWIVATGRAEAVDAVILVPVVALSALALRIRAATDGDRLVIRNFLRRHVVDRQEITRIGTVRDLTWFGGWWPQERVVIRTRDGRDLPVDATIGFRASAAPAPAVGGGPARSRRWFERLRAWIDEREPNATGPGDAGPVPSPDGG